jgi:hypothetical protein
VRECPHPTRFFQQTLRSRVPRASPPLPYPNARPERVELQSSVRFQRGQKRDGDSHAAALTHRMHG